MTLSILSPARLFEVLDETWPAAEKSTAGPFTLRKGLGGGNRVSCATANGPASTGQISKANDVMQRMGQAPRYMIRPMDGALDETLETLGFHIADPTVVFSAEINALTNNRPDPLRAILCDEPLSLMVEFWAANDIPPARIDVMRRVTGPKTYIFSRNKDMAAGAAFVAIHNNIAMLHALAVASDHRRMGVAENILAGAAFWAADQGAEHFSVVTTSKNLPAQRLFTGLGMENSGKYHYRTK